MTRVWRRGVEHVRTGPFLITLLASLPMLWSSLRGIRAGWFPLGDEALTGLSAFDVFTGHPPVMGPRTTTAFETGIESHHPGPLLYYLLAPTSALADGAPWGLIVGSAIITLLIIALGVHAADRLGGPLMATAIGCAFLGVQWALGPEAGARPFNPYPPAFALLTFLVLTWALLDERLEYTPHYVAVTSVMLQGHVGYLPFVAGPLVVLAVVGLFRWARRRRTIWPLKGWRPQDDGHFRWPVRGAALVGLLVWTPPAIELFRFSPNNLQQILAYIGADRGEPIPALTALRFVVGLVGPVPGGMAAAVNGADHVGAHMTPPSTSVTGTVVGLLLLVLVLAMSVLAGSRRVRRSVPDTARRWLPSRRESRAAGVALIGFAALSVTVTRLPVSSAQSSWNYLQAWPVVFFIWSVLVAYGARLILVHLHMARGRLQHVAALLLVSAMLAALMSPAPTRWHEGDGVAAGMDALRDHLAKIQSHHQGRLHVTFDGDTLGAGYYVAPALAHAIKADYAVHLPAVWQGSEDTDFRKSVTAPEDTAWVSIRAGRKTTLPQDVNERSVAVTTVTDSNGHDYTLFVRGPNPS